MAAFPHIQRAIWALDGDQPIGRVARVEDLYAEAFGRQQFVLTIMGAFAVVALILTAAGIFGVLSHAVAQRTREIGIRMALGARPSAVMHLILSRGLALALIGAVIGIAGASALSKLLQSLLFEVSATDPLSFGVVVALIGVVALLACWLPARTAMNVQPSTALRVE